MICHKTFLPSSKILLTIKRQNEWINYLLLKKRAEYFLQSVITTKHQTIFISIHALYNLLYVLGCRLVRHFYFTLLDLKIFLCKGLQKIMCKYWHVFNYIVLSSRSIYHKKEKYYESDKEKMDLFGIVLPYKPMLRLHLCLERLCHTNGRAFNKICTSYAYHWGSGDRLYDCQCSRTNHNDQWWVL